MCACMFGHTDIVKLMFDHPDDRSIELNAKDNFGRTVFMFACKNGHKDVVNLMLEHSKIVNISLPKFFDLSNRFLIPLENFLNNKLIIGLVCICVNLL